MRWSTSSANLNQVYMAGLMAAPMVLIELALMGAMYRNRTANVVIVLGSVLVLAGCFLAIRQQTAIGDSQFLRSMIPHHSGAILMCQKASVGDAELQKLCRQIIESQRAEIAQMKSMLQKGAAN